MIVEYHRPETINAVLQLLAREDPLTYPLGGGTVLNLPSPDPIAVVDLQALGLDNLEQKGDSWIIGATVTLQQLIRHEELYPALRAAIRHEASYNIRQVATTAGTLVSGDGRSPFAAVMLAIGAQLVIMPGNDSLPFGEFLLFQEENHKGHFIIQIIVPANIKLAYEYVARTPADLPIVCVAVAQWPSGRTRVVLGGFGKSVLLASDGPNADGAVAAARDAYREAADDWASAEYRSDIAATLTGRCLQF